MAPADRQQQQQQSWPSAGDGGNSWGARGHTATAAADNNNSNNNNDRKEIERAQSALDQQDAEMVRLLQRMAKEAQDSPSRKRAELAAQQWEGARFESGSSSSSSSSQQQLQQPQFQMPRPAGAGTEEAGQSQQTVSACFFSCQRRSFVRETSSIVGACFFPLRAAWKFSYRNEARIPPPHQELPPLTRPPSLSFRPHARPSAPYPRCSPSVCTISSATSAPEPGNNCSSSSNGVSSSALTEERHRRRRRRARRLRRRPRRAPGSRPSFITTSSTTRRASSRRTAPRPRSLPLRPPGLPRCRGLRPAATTRSSRRVRRTAAAAAAAPARTETAEAT